MKPRVEPPPDEADAQALVRRHVSRVPFHVARQSSYRTPSLASASGGQPFHSETKVFPTYRRSCTPMRLEKNPDAVRSRNRLKNATPTACSGFAFPGHAMASSTALRSAAVQPTNVLP